MAFQNDYEREDVSEKITDETKAKVLSLLNDRMEPMLKELLGFTDEAGGKIEFSIKVKMEKEALSGRFIVKGEAPEIKKILAPKTESQPTVIEVDQEKLEL